MGRIRKIKNADNLISKFSWFLKEPRNLYFDNKNKTHLEIGCGKGDFIIQIAQKFPNINFIGIEKDTTIILKLLRKINVLVIKPINLLIIKADATNCLDWFKKSSIDHIYLNFSDPWPKKRHEKKRLTAKIFLNIYHYILVNGGTVEYKTDNHDFFLYSLESLRTFNRFKVIYFTDDLYSDDSELANNVQSEYEKKFVSQNKKICKITFVC